MNQQSLIINLHRLSTRAVLLSGTGTINSSSVPEFLPDFKFYPNPASNRLFIEIQEEPQSILKLQLFDQAGRMLEEIGKNKILGGGIEINTANYAEGLYFVRIMTKTKQTTGKFSIKR